MWVNESSERSRRYSKTILSFDCEVPFLFLDYWWLITKSQYIICYYCKSSNLFSLCWDMYLVSPRTFATPVCILCDCIFTYFYHYVVVSLRRVVYYLLKTSVIVLFCFVLLSTCPKCTVTDFYHLLYYMLVNWVLFLLFLPCPLCTEISVTCEVLILLVHVCFVLSFFFYFVPHIKLVYLALFFLLSYKYGAH